MADIPQSCESNRFCRREHLPKQFISLFPYDIYMTRCMNLAKHRFVNGVGKDSMHQRRSRHSSSSCELNAARDITQSSISLWSLYWWIEFLLVGPKQPVTPPPTTSTSFSKKHRMAESLGICSSNAFHK